MFKWFQKTLKEKHEVFDNLDESVEKEKRLKSVLNKKLVDMTKEDIEILKEYGFV